ncbi:hypothetical protein Mal64_25180 [Pseudobythopirellula maris]|uniref:Activator of Hsp90 ATPase homologue 1/2-like C-terminal domain-containing protein n=1 Tax=Pseudobythopirellula maris TaxID=2527991 RepID=A0A5C5ZQ24_9BACT|nr:SRPBCC domain-containing protein [Pseudobythopirellula maris]TWT89027.1 hypothetical protein Mal64_25180 [Pseudobythopirellula maris]
MPTAAHEELTFDVTQEIEIAAPIGEVYKALVAQITTENTTPDNRPMPLVLEEWPGGRWFRDLGAGQGHLWGFVQVIKPPTLIEVQGPLFMSYPVSGHVQWQLTQVAGGTELLLSHRAFGMIDPEHREGAVPGWRHILDSVKKAAEGGS